MKDEKKCIETNFDSFAKRANCCGCSACANICIAKAIKMTLDKKGFLYPFIDDSKCIGCGMCLKVCNFKTFSPTNHTPRAFACKHNNTNEVETSRSGAVFIALSEYILNHNGVVFGCKAVTPRQIEHQSAVTKEEVNSFKGSKYVQSVIGNTFRECADNLKNGRMCLFSGTGCQVHGLISYLKALNIDTNKLITCDMVCHGTPSQQLWEDYLNAIEKKNGKTITSANFRDKKKAGWRAHVESFVFDDGTTTTTTNYSNAYYQHALFRESCYRCKYTTPNRLTDFTIADCWHVESAAPELDDNKGVSLLLIHTPKGESIFDEIKDKLKYRQVPLEKVMQAHLMRPVDLPNNYEAFWKKYMSNKEKAVNRLFFPSKISLLFQKAKYVLKK